MDFAAQNCYIRGMVELILCFKPRAVHAEPKAAIETLRVSVFSAFGGESKPPAMRVVVDCI